ncbi:MAG: hypothetical protein PHT54_00970 [Candidatus Nanoarchaeia archaeon]|nr:hypothetical protein [Candidatus Nanoarchaeia archaeon]
MICVIAMVVFGILGIFSVKYRTIAKESFDCVFRRITLRPCTTGLDERLKGQITGKLMKRSPKIAAFTYKYFEVFSWLFLILLIGSLVYSGISAYNLIAYGNCGGPDPEDFCVFDPSTYSTDEACECTTDKDCTCPESVCKCLDGKCVP